MVRPAGTPEALGRRLYRIRLIQTLICAVNFITSVYVSSYIGSRHLGLLGGPPVSAIMSGLSFILTSFGNWLGGNFEGYEKRRCLSLFLVFDLVCVGLQVAAIAVLAVAGLPSKCTGLTSPAPPEEQPKDGYSTTRFSDGSGRTEAGMLDHLCGLPKSYFWLAIILLISYFYTMGLSFRLIFALRRRAREIHQAEIAGSGNHQSNQVPQPTPGTSERVTSPRFHISVPISNDRESDIFERGQETFHSVSRDSYTGSSSTHAGSPPPYQADQEGKKFPLSKGKH